MKTLLVILLCLIPNLTYAGDLDLNWGYSIGIAPWNPSYAARPDNTGLTLLKYGGYTDLFYDHLGIGLTVGMYTDRYSQQWMLPSELDLTPSLMFKWDAYEMRVSYERDMPVDRRGFVQNYMYILFSRNGRAGLKKF